MADYSMVAVLIPCYNEEQTISKVVTDYKKALPGATIYVYDNNSKDNTVKNAIDAGAIVRYEYKQGKGNVVRRMFQGIDADCYLLVDGDDTYNASDAVNLVQDILEKQVDMSLGDRLSSTYFDENKRRFHNFGNRLVRSCVNLIFKQDYPDIMTGYRAFSRRFVKTFPVLSRGFEIETEMCIHAADKNMSVHSCKIQYSDRPDGSVSKLNTISDGIKVMWMILKLWTCYAPLRFFGLLSFIICIIGILLFIPIGKTFYMTGLVPKIPTLLLCVMLWLTAILMLFCGFIAEILHQSERRKFEIDLLREVTNCECEKKE